MRADSRGFTLVEMMVSITIFALAMTVVSQLFLYSLRVERRLIAHSQLVNEMSYDMEHFGRGMRMAKKRMVADPNTCLDRVGVNFNEIMSNGSVTGIKFQNSNLIEGQIDCVQYYICSPSQPCHPAGYPDDVTVLMESHSGINGTFNLPLTSPKINITNFKVLLTGESQEDEIQPRVTIYIQAKNNENESMESQITVSQRDLDYRERTE